jgi:hypothetical protein
MSRPTINFRRIVRSAESFKSAIHQLRRDAGLSTGRAILVAKRHDPEGFSAWMKKRWNSPDRGSEGGGSMMRHFKIIGG